jgi:biotin transporter BioY
MKNKQSPIVACLIATCLILFFGYIGLLSFMNWKAALIYGVIVFIPSDILKMFIAVKLAKRIHP